MNNKNFKEFFQNVEAIYSFLDKYWNNGTFTKWIMGNMHEALVEACGKFLEEVLKEIMGNDYEEDEE